MFLGIGVLFFVIIVIYLWRSRIKVDVPSFFKPSLPLNRGAFGVYCFTGKQGSGKTYGVNKFIRKYRKSDDAKIFSNITHLDYKYERITSIEHLLSLKDERNCFIIFDEIFTFMTKTTKFNSEIMEFLSQMRKQENIFVTTAQEWLELPMTFRRFVRIQVECRTIPLGGLGGLFIEDYFDATQMKWSQLDNEYVAPVIAKKISKYERKFMQSYDTYERIRIMPN